MLQGIYCGSAYGSNDFGRNEQPTLSIHLYGGNTPSGSEKYFCQIPT